MSDLLDLTPVERVTQLYADQRIGRSDCIRELVELGLDEHEAQICADEAEAMQ